MTEPLESKKMPNKTAVVGLKLGSTTVHLTGASALITVSILLAMVVLLIYLVKVTSDSLLWVSAILWVLFIGYWSAAAGNAAATKASESAASRRLHQLLMYGALAFCFVPVLWLGRRWLPDARWVVPIGLALHVSSALLAIWARRHLGANWSGAITSKVDHQLVRSGPYRVVRHPIYSGMLGMFIGTAFVSGELHAAVGVILIAAAYLRKIRLEERSLRSAFGDAYDEYRRNSWALIPGLL